MVEKLNGFMKEVKFIIPIVLTCFLTGSFVAFLPIIFNYLLDWIVGYNIDLNKYVADYFLVVFSISVNTCVCFLGVEEKLSKHIKTFVVIILIFFMIPSWEVYRMLFNENIKSDIKEKLLSGDSNLLMAVQIGAVVIIINYIITTIIGVVTEKIGKRKQQKVVKYEEMLNNIKDVIKEKNELSVEELRTIGTILEEVK